MTWQKTPDYPALQGVGIGLRHAHFDAFLETPPPIDWLEVHTENFFGAGGKAVHALDTLRKHYPISLHGVGLSLGSAEGLDKTHLRKLSEAVHRFKPALVSEHLSWNAANGTHLPDLLPLPFTKEALEMTARNIEQVQEAIKQQILVENPSSYLTFCEHDMSEPEFLNTLAQKTGCGLLLDVNNIYVSSRNIDFNPQTYLETINATYVMEIHLAGYHVNKIGQEEMLIDFHGAPVSDPVWTLYRAALEACGPIPTLVEWDTDVPAPNILLGEARKAAAIMKEHTMQTPAYRTYKPSKTHARRA